MSNKIAFVFPGQGSQSIGMLADMAAEFPLIKTTFQEGSAALGFDLWDLVQNGPEEKLNETMYTQPALLAASVAMWRVWVAQGGVKPEFFAGHSLGEYSALVCAEAIDFKDAILLVRDRGQYMQQAVPAGKGAMAAVVGLDDEVVNNICKDAAAGEILVPANYNSPGQIVLAGEINAINRAILLAKAAGAKIAKLLSVSVPSHCDYMKPAADKLAELLAKIQINSPKTIVLHNYSVAYYNEPEQICTALVKQLVNPVRWVEIIRYMVDHGVTNIYECGPGKVLSGLNRRISKNIECDILCVPSNFSKILTSNLGK